MSWGPGQKHLSIICPFERIPWFITQSRGDVIISGMIIVTDLLLVCRFLFTYGHTYKTDVLTSILEALTFRFNVVCNVYYYKSFNCYSCLLGLYQAYMQ